MIRVVLDTNVIVSAVISPAGPNAKLLNHAVEGRVKLFVTEELLEEYRKVFDYERLAHLNRRKIALLLGLLTKVAVAVKPRGRLRLSPDEDDNRVYECAVAANANFLVTENRRHFPVAYKATRITNARSLNEVLDLAGL